MGSIRMNGSSAITKTNEIALLELGTETHRLRRSSRDEWLSGTRGFYWGCNNTKDLAVRLETVSSVVERPTDVTWKPTDRDRTWLKLYREHAGRIDANFGKLAFTTPPLAGFPTIDAKVTTAAMAKGLTTHALFGPPLGKVWKPTFEERTEDSLVSPARSSPVDRAHDGRSTETGRRSRHARGYA